MYWIEASTLFTSAVTADSVVIVGVVRDEVVLGVDSVAVWFMDGDKT